MIRFRRRLVATMKTLQTAEVVSDLGRDGKIETPGRTFAIDFAPADETHGITPEHLFAGAYAACFHSALKSAAERANLDISGSTVVARVELGDEGNNQSALAVTLRASLPGASDHEARRLLHDAHQSCPYSRAVRNNITVNLELD
jgi:osmotically inducible protein OsmC